MSGRPPVPPRGKLDTSAPRLPGESECHQEPPWCMSDPCPAPLHVLGSSVKTLKTPIPTQLSEAASHYLAPCRLGACFRETQTLKLEAETPLQGESGSCVSGEALALAPGQALLTNLEPPGSRISPWSLSPIRKNFFKRSLCAVRDDSSIKRHAVFLVWRRAAAGTRESDPSAARGAPHPRPPRPPGGLWGPRRRKGQACAGWPP